MSTAPPPEAPFAEKLEYYRSEHSSKGIQATHLVGGPIILFGMPLIFAKPKVGVPMFVGGWTLNILGHRLFQKNTPSTHKGPLTYQLAGIVHVAETYGEFLARRSQRKAARRAHRAGWASEGASEATHCADAARSLTRQS